MTDRYKITFLPLDRTSYATREESLLEVAMRSGVHINASCGGNGTCGRCRIRVLSGDVSSPPTGVIPLEEYDAGVRLACDSYPRSNATVAIPLESQIDREALRRTGPEEKILSASQRDGLIGGWAVKPPAVRKYLELRPPTLEDNADDMTRLLLELKRTAGLDTVFDFDLLDGLPRKLRDAAWKVTAALFYTGSDWIIQSIEEGNREGVGYAVAVDIGTTTVCAQLLDIGQKHARPSGREDDTQARTLAESSDYNGQIAYGEDVISRIMYAQKGDGLKKLQASILATINRLIVEMTDRAGLCPEDVSLLVLAGNTTMTHLLLGLDPRYLMVEPYVPAAADFPPVKAERWGLHAGKGSRAWVFPSVASYVGGDIVAGVLASGMFQRDETTLFIDVGTNGEIVVGNREWLTCASCSAGPAFEGGGIGSGMRAGKGAIEQVLINPVTYEPMLLTIGKAKPVGICGSGLIDAMAELFRTGVIEQNGRINRNAETQRVRERDGVWEYVLCYGPDSGNGKDIVLTEGDIDNLLRAKAAVYAGCRVLLENVGLDMKDIERVIIAGGFGHYIGLEKARIIGLLPDIPDSKFLFLGNGSLLGARLACLSCELGREAKALAGRMTNIELSTSTRFMDEFVAALFLPHTDEHLFPRVTRHLRKDRRGVRP